MAQRKMGRLIINLMSKQLSDHLQIMMMMKKKNQRINKDEVKVIPKNGTLKQPGNR